ncbi:hypothetical protein AXXA_21128 [Achromobacter insuavis AXX-A]|uniref:Uncharacterized protein n=1 Tax=Achromobacter insuavis AXX-A TaxID=1003200 RepID=F7T5K0_9BURK|nr:hypothetical protein AXXA_21128 [Achromobacter insuavis AXX-A]
MDIATLITTTAAMEAANTRRAQRASSLAENPAIAVFSQ